MHVTHCEHTACDPVGHVSRCLAQLSLHQCKCQLSCWYAVHRLSAVTRWSQEGVTSAGWCSGGRRSGTGNAAKAGLVDLGPCSCRHGSRAGCARSDMPAKAQRSVRRTTEAERQSEGCGQSDERLHGQDVTMHCCAVLRLAGTVCCAASVLDKPHHTHGAVMAQVRVMCTPCAEDAEQ